MEVLNDDTQVKLSKGVNVDACLRHFFLNSYFYSCTFLGMIKNMTESSFPFSPPTPKPLLGFLW